MPTPDDFTSLSRYHNCGTDSFILLPKKCFQLVYLIRLLHLCLAPGHLSNILGNVALLSWGSASSILFYLPSDASQPSFRCRFYRTCFAPMFDLFGYLPFWRFPTIMAAKQSFHDLDSADFVPTNFPGGPCSMLIHLRMSVSPFR